LGQEGSKLERCGAGEVSVKTPFGRKRDKKVPEAGVQAKKKQQKIHGETGETDSAVWQRGGGRETRAEDPGQPEKHGEKSSRCHSIGPFGRGPAVKGGLKIRCGKEK